ncbi:hypothetical protein NYE37_13840 [Thermoactinomyces sp. FSL K6-2592]|jgi:hypothetical protein|uniref:hypothetical protein n=1 Tax=Thermoactinomyces sp. FSL K6-2592 TaxID=2975347 RepID=UPI0030F862C5
MNYPTHIRTKKIIEFISLLNSRVTLKKRQKEETTEEVFRWELEGQIRELEMIILELESLVLPKK